MKQSSAQRKRLTESGIILIDVNQLTVLKNALIAFPHAAVIPSALSKERCLRLAGQANYGRFSRGSAFLQENGYYLPMPIYAIAQICGVDW